MICNQAPRQVKVKTWKSVELNGLVYVWYHAENIDPYWDPVRITELNSNDSDSKHWVYRGRNEFEAGYFHYDIVVDYLLLKSFCIKISKKFTSPIVLLGCMSY